MPEWAAHWWWHSRRSRMWRIFPRRNVASSDLRYGPAIILYPKCMTGVFDPTICCTLWTYDSVPVPIVAKMWTSVRVWTEPAILQPTWSQSRGPHLATTTGTLEIMTLRSRGQNEIYLGRATASCRLSRSFAAASRSDLHCDAQIFRVHDSIDVVLNSNTEVRNALYFVYSMFT